MKKMLLGILLVAAAGLAACSGPGAQQGKSAEELRDEILYQDKRKPRSTFRDFLFGRRNTDQIGGVNKYLWQASLDVLEFLPVEEVDPFTGVIVTGYGTPPGGGRAYRATVLITDPALDARSLNVALMTRAGPVSAATQKAVEDAILARARQLRIRDAGF